MKIQDGPLFLVSDFNYSTNQFRISLKQDLSEAISCWTSLTRISPVWLVGLTPLASLSIVDNGTLIFLGPIDPFTLEDSGLLEDPLITHFITLGCYNVVLHFPPKKSYRKIDNWLTANRINREIWRVKNGLVAKQVDISLVQSVQDTSETSDRLNKIFSKQYKSEINLALSEFGPLIASTLARAALYSSDAYVELKNTLQQVENCLENLHLDSERRKSLASLAAINAGLSRFSSQAFSGTSPIQSTECHFWSHSLLGIGTANKAVDSIVDFVREKLGKGQIPDRFSCLEYLRDSTMAYETIEPGQFWNIKYDYNNYREATGVKLTDKVKSILINSYPPGANDLLPKLVFFSGRDGFRTNHINVSVPLICINSANTYRWSLQPITHEISHIIIRPIIADLLPSKPSKEGLGLYDFNKAKEIFDNSGDSNSRENVLDSLRYWMLILVNDIHDGPASSEGGYEDNEVMTATFEIEKILSVLPKWRGEIEEIMVHAFDYAYFYGSAEKYIESIWSTWSVIPNVESRLSDYIVRSICALQIDYLHRKDVVERELLTFLNEQLQKLKNSNPDMDFLDSAISYINENFENICLTAVLRKGLVRIVNKFLVTNEIANALKSESPSRVQGKQGKQLLQIDNLEISNPLNFIEAFSKALHPSPSKSCWLYQCLAYNYRSERSDE